MKTNHKLLALISIIALSFSGSAPAQDTEIPKNRIGVPVSPVQNPETDKEAEAKEFVQIALNVCEKAFTSENLRKALEITENVGGFDNEAVISPWMAFCEKHKSKVFIAVSTGKVNVKDVKRLFTVTTWCLENEMEIQPFSEQKRFELQHRQLEQLANLPEGPQ